MDEANKKLVLIKHQLLIPESLVKVCSFFGLFHSINLRTTYIFRVCILITRKLH